MMTLHIFNPEHDIALASNLSNFTAPHAGRRLRHCLGYLPALWAAPDDVVMVDDEVLAGQSFQKMLNAVRHHLCRSLPCEAPQFVPCKSGVFSVQPVAVSPWGWDRAMKSRLLRCGVSVPLLPEDGQLDDIRMLSHRRTSAWLLPQLQVGNTVGEAYECRSAEEVDALAGRYGRIVMKAPWSSSGRGLRFSDACQDNSEKRKNDEGWLRHLLATQGSVMVEPFYNKAKDFGMEFTSTPDGEVRYEGLSLFHTANGAYTGNILATERVKREMMGRYVSVATLDEVREQVCRLLMPVLRGKYAGPFGIDMMVVDGKLHPCVEINLRRTMGHVALALSPHDDDILRVMRITYSDDAYKMKIERL